MSDTSLMDTDDPADNPSMTSWTPTPESAWDSEQRCAARFRAAFAWAGYPGPQEIGSALGFSKRTASRYLAGEPLKNGESRYTIDLWNRVQTLTGAPAWFVEHGWEGANVPNEVGLAERVERLEHETGVLLKILKDRVSRSLADDVIAQPPARPEGRVDRPGKGPPE